MRFFSASVIITGIIFIDFGYFIYFHKKYNLINGFKEDFKAEIKTEAYAKRVGLIELALGIVLVLIGIMFL